MQLRLSKKLLLAVASTVAALCIAVFVVLPPVARHVLEDKLSANLHRKVSVRSVSVNPFTLSLKMDGLAVNDPKGGTFVSFDKLYVSLGAASIFKGGVVVKEVRLRRPYIRVVRNEDLSYNFSDLLERKGPPGKPLKFAVSNIHITDGGADFIDRPANAAHSIRDVNIGLPILSNMDYYVETFVQPSFSAKVNGTPVVFKGETKPFSNSLETRFEFDLKGLSIPHYLAYAPYKLSFGVPSGLLDARMAVSYMQYKSGKPPSLSVSGDAAVRNLKVTDEKDMAVLEVPSLDVSIISTDIFARKAHIESIMLDGVKLNVEKNQSGEINLITLLGKGGKEAPQESGCASVQPRIDVDLVRFTNGRIAFSDSAPGGPFRAVLEPVDATVVNFSNVHDWKSFVSLSLTTDAGESLKLNGGITLDPLRAEGRVELNGMPLRRYSPYYKNLVLFDVEDGVLNLATAFRYSAVKESPEERLYDLNLTLSSVRLKKSGETSDFLTARSLTLSGTDIDLVKKELAVGSLSAKEGFIGARRFKDGNMNLLSLMKTPAKNAKAPEAKAEKPWSVRLGSVAVDSWTLKMVDLWPPKPATLVAKDFSLHAENMSTDKGSKGSLSVSFSPGGKGSFRAEGTAGINPVSFVLKTALKDTEVASMQPYFYDKIKMDITGGRVSADGGLSVGFTPKTGYSVRYTGDIGMSGFSSVDRMNAEDLLKWKSFNMKGVDISYNPNHVNIKSVLIDGCYAKLIINPDGTLNVLEVIGSAAPAKQGTTKEAPKTAAAQPVQPTQPEQPYPARIDKVELKGGRVSFTDRSVKPSYFADLMDVNGSVTGLSSEETMLAGVGLKCSLNGSAPLEITGRVNPLKKDLYVDLSVDFRNMDLSPFSPYSGKYIGYTIHKGKLALNLKYLIDGKKLDSKNNIFIDQLDLGDKVESPGATKLPVKLAIALLRDRRGEIHLDVPVTGRTDDPKFSIWKIIGHIILNVIVKAATSPFALLGSLFGHGEELGYVEFGYGGSALDQQATGKLDTLSKALFDRPSLKLSIEGHADPENDGASIRQQIFDRKLKAQKLKEMISDGLPAVQVNEVNIAHEEYEKYLKLAYKAEDFKKPKTMLVFNKSLPPAEMEKLIREHITVTEDLRRLAAERAEKIKNYILGTGKVEPERVFVTEPKSVSPKEKKGVKGSRVDFILS